MNESEQICRAQTGDDVAWRALMLQHRQAVFRLAYLLLGEADEAEDVTQEVFVRSFQALARFDAARPLRPWLLQITRNLAHNRRRSLRRHLAALQRWWQDRLIHTAPPTATHRDEAEQLWRAVQCLRTQDQEVIYLRYFLEMSGAETAAALTVPEGTVKSRLSRALHRLRAVVEAEFPDLVEDVDR